jgi:glycosyltransferase involved in cell wall biosynthesis
MENINRKFVSIIAPTLNEELTIAEFIRWCREGLSRAGAEGEILIVDSSSDRTAEIAESLGARVLKVPKRGLGRAYIDAIPLIRGDTVIMGDADCTYDFREIKIFIEKLDQGYEYVMGTRMKGTIEKGAMPGLHRYFGTPLTTWILNALLGTRFSDIHCGLRAITLDALKKMAIQSQSWEYASEMVVKAGLMKLKCAEVPIRFYKDRQGRQSHHKRLGWFSPWQAGWINLKVMLLYAPHQMVIKPGVLFLFLGLGLIFMQAGGSVTVGPVTFSTSFMLLGLAFSVLGISAVQMGILVESFSDVSEFYASPLFGKFKNYFTYTCGMVLGVFFFFTGFILSSVLIAQWFAQGLKLTSTPWYAVFGIFMIIFGIQTILFNLVYQTFLLKRKV